MSTDLQDKLLSLAHMARALSLPQKWLKAEVEAGRLPALRAGTRLLFSRAAVEQALLERAKQPDSAKESARAITGGSS